VAKKLYVGNLTYDTTEDNLVELFSEFGMSAAGPDAEVLLAKSRLLGGSEPERRRCFACAAGGATNDQLCAGQLSAEPGQARKIARVGRRIRIVDDAVGSVDRRMPDEPKMRFTTHVRPYP